MSAVWIRSVLILILAVLFCPNSWASDDVSIHSGVPHLGLNLLESNSLEACDLSSISDVKEAFDFSLYLDSYQTRKFDAFMALIHGYYHNVLAVYPESYHMSKEDELPPMVLDYFDHHGRFITDNLFRESLYSSLSHAECILLGLQNPIKNAFCTARFGEGRNGGIHLGMDFGSPVNTPVHAVAPGRVLFAGKLTGFHQYGRIVIIDHGRGLFSLYGHVRPSPKFICKSKAQYKPRNVCVGEEIGYIANVLPDESSTGPHLHLELMMANHTAGQPWCVQLNPAQYLPAYCRELPKFTKCNYAPQSESRSTKRAFVPAKAERGLLCVLKSLAYQHPSLEEFLPAQKIRKDRGSSAMKHCQAAERLRWLGQLQEFSRVHPGIPFAATSFHFPLQQPWPRNPTIITDNILTR